MDSVVGLYQVSLVAAFGAGMVALLAPCCISFLLPSYLGNVFRERSKVLLMTLVYSLGIFTVMLPIVLGARALSLFFFRWHDQSYLAAGVFLLVIAGLTFFNVKLPWPHLVRRQRGSIVDIWSTYTLGVFSGITSACCAPVLLGVVGLSVLSTNFWGAVGVGLAYVLGMVFPLYVAGYLLDKGNILERPWLRLKLGEIKLGGSKRPILLTNVVGASIFGLMGGLILVLTAQGKLGMPGANATATRMINEVAYRLTAWGQQVPVANFVLALVLVWFLWKIVERITGKKQ